MIKVFSAIACGVLACAAFGGGGIGRPPTAATPKPPMAAKMAVPAASSTPKAPVSATPKASIGTHLNSLRSNVSTKVYALDRLARKAHRELPKEPLVVDKLQLNKNLPQPKDSR